MTPSPHAHRGLGFYPGKPCYRDLVLLNGALSGESDTPRAPPPLPQIVKTFARKNHSFRTLPVGDNHKGPLNNQGKPAKTRITDQLTHLKHMHNTIATLVAPAARQGGTAGRPSSEVRLARGLDAPSGEFCLARGLNDPSCEYRLARGLNAPSAGSASPEGSTPPLGRGPPRSRVQRPLGEDRLTRGYLHARFPGLPPCTDI
jgi:hypothetical protein